jgi:hypothetical protein
MDFLVGILIGLVILAFLNIFFIKVVSRRKCSICIMSSKNIKSISDIVTCNACIHFVRRDNFVSGVLSRDKNINIGGEN